MRRVKSSATSASSVIADESPKIEFLRKEGWLDKLSPRSILKDVWQTRWVVLAEGEMCYFKEPGTVPLGVLPLSHVEKVSGVGNRVILTMKSQYSNREWKWRATETALDAEQWRDALEEVRVAASSAAEFSTRYTESGVIDGKYWKRLDPAYKKQSMIAGRSYRGSVAPATDRTGATSELATNSSLKKIGESLTVAGEGVEVEDTALPRWMQKRGLSQSEKRSKEVLYMEGMLTKLNKHVGHAERFYVLNGNKMTGYKNAGQVDRISTWFMEQLTRIEVLKVDGRYQLSLELNGVEQCDLVGRSEEEIRQWASKLAAAHFQFGGQLNIADLLHGSSKKSSLYKQLESQNAVQHASVMIDLWCTNFDDRAGKDLKSFLDVCASLDGGLLAQLESQLLPGTEITKHAMQCLHDCLYGVIVHFIDDWQMQPPALIVRLVDWIGSYYMRLKRMGVVVLYPDILNMPSTKEMIESTCPTVTGHLLLPKKTVSGKPKFLKRWFSMMGSRIRSFDSSEQEDAGAHPLQTILLSNIVCVERDGKQIKLFFPNEASTKKATVSAPEKNDAKSSRFPTGFITDLINRLVREKEDGTLPFDSKKPFSGFELAEWMCSVTDHDTKYKIKRRDVSQGLAQSLISNGAVTRVDGGADWDEDVDYIFPLVEEETLLQELEIWAENEDTAVLWQTAIACARHALTDNSRRRFGNGTPEIKTRFDDEGQSFILDEVQSVAVDVFQKCMDLTDYLTGSQKLLDRASSYLDDLMFDEEFKDCFDCVFDSFFMKAFSVIINYCRENHHHWQQVEFIAIASWASTFEARVLQYDESKVDMFNVVDQIFFVDLMSVYNETVSQEIERLILNLISEDIKAKSEPLITREGQLKSLAIVDLMVIYNQSISIVIGTGNAVVTTAAIKYTLPVLELFPKTYLQQMQANASALPIEHVVSVLNAFHEGSHCIQELEDQLRAIVPEKFFEQLSFDGPSGAFNRAWKEGSKIVAQMMSVDVHPLIQKVGDKSWLNGSVTANWLATVRDYFGDLVRWMIPAVLRKLSSDILDDNLRAYVKAILSSKINIDETFLERTDSDIDMIKAVFIEFTRINLVSSRIGLITEFVELLACDFDDVRRGFMSLVLSSDIHIGILERILELRDCKRSVKKDILEECRVGWEEPEVSDDEATYSLVLSGVDINQIPFGSERFSLFSECSVSGIWPDWKERRDKDRKNRIAALKERKEHAAHQLKERGRQADHERRQASLAAHLKALENAKKNASEKARDGAKKQSTPSTQSSIVSANIRGVDASVSDGPSVGSRSSVDMSLSQIRALQKAIAEEKSSATLKRIEDTVTASTSCGTTETVPQSTVPATFNNEDGEVSTKQLNATVLRAAKETMKEKIARQKREAELATASGTPPSARDAFRIVVQEAVIASIEEEKGFCKETLKEKIARQKREAELAAAGASAPAPSTPTPASLDADAVMRSRSDSSTGKETLKEKIARQKREAELNSATSSPTDYFAASSLSINADEFRSGVGKETLKEKIARQKIESEMAAMSTSEISLPIRVSANLSEQQSNGLESGSGKETLKEKIARQKREAELAAAGASAPAPSTPTPASLDADAVMRSRSDSSTGKETLKEKIARAKRETELAASSALSLGKTSIVTFEQARTEDMPIHASSSIVKETLKERIARQKLESGAAMGAKTTNSDSDAENPRQPMIATTIIGGLGARRGSSAFIRSIQHSPGHGSEMRNA